MEEGSEKPCLVSGGRRHFAPPAIPGRLVQAAVLVYTCVKGDPSEAGSQPAHVLREQGGGIFALSLALSNLLSLIYMV